MCCACLLSVLFPGPARTDSSRGRDVGRLDEVTVSARGVPAPVSSTPGGVEVATSADIVETNPASIAEVLARLPGVSKNGDSPWSADVNIRGLSRDSVVVLIDGVRVNMTTDINGRLGVVAQDDIERIEVLKGPVSALYGQGSTGGVVNIITKKGRFTEKPEWHGEAVTAFSSNPLGPDAYLNLSHGDEDHWAFVSGSFREHHSAFDGRGEKIKNSQFEDFQGKLAAALRWSETQRSMIQYQQMNGDNIGIPGGQSALPSNADVTLEHNDRRMVQFVHSVEPKDLFLKLSELEISYQIIERDPRIDNFTSGAVAKLSPNADHETTAGRWKNVMAFGPHRVVGGMEASSWDMRGSRVRQTTTGAIVEDKAVPIANQLTSGVFAEDDWTLSEQWVLNLGARLDEVAIVNDGIPTASAGSRNDESWGAHLGLTFTPVQAWTFTWLTATSYRTPNIQELFKNISLSGGITEVGNPDLRSEQSLFNEFGVRYAGDGWRTKTALYANFVDDLIQSERRSATLYRMANVGKAEIYGAEQSLDWDFAQGWTAFAQASYTTGRDVSHGVWLASIAPLNGLAGVKQTIGEFWWTVEAQWAASQDDTPSGTASASAWTIMNARLGYAMDLAGLRNEFTVGVNNVFDTSYRNYLTTSRGIEVREPGANAFANWKVTF
jgi:hemoglobin/transferrin/lactoferrin receptor protein